MFEWHQLTLNWHINRNTINKVNNTTVVTKASVIVRGHYSTFYYKIISHLLNIVLYYNNIIPGPVSITLYSRYLQMCEMRKQCVDIWRNVILQYNMTNCMMSTYIIDLFYSAGCSIILHPLIISSIYTGCVEPHLILGYKICATL